jgi:hypothetical protein
MVSDLFFSQLVLSALAWLCVILHWGWPGDRVVYLSPADKYYRLTCRLPQGQKGLDEGALMAS